MSIYDHDVSTNIETIGANLHHFFHLIFCNASRKFNQLSFPNSCLPCPQKENLDTYEVMQLNHARVLFLVLFYYIVSREFLNF